MKNNGPLTATIDRFENGLAVLEFDHNQMLTVTRRHLPKDAREGDVVEIEFLTDELATKRRGNLAKAMLEEILKGE
jgi:hypothetical protein